MPPSSLLGGNRAPFFLSTNVYRDGERNIGLKILAVINAEPAEAAEAAETEDPTEE